MNTDKTKMRSAGLINEAKNLNYYEYLHSKHGMPVLQDDGCKRIKKNEFVLYQP
ncbi:MAG: hypothetical protein ACJASQ_001210 [Crocinitomicaceae bacterium]|jgi:hypothetical protein